MTDLHRLELSDIAGLTLHVEDDRFPYVEFRGKRVYIAAYSDWGVTGVAPSEDPTYVTDGPYLEAM